MTSPQGHIGLHLEGAHPPRAAVKIGVHHAALKRAGEGNCGPRPQLVYLPPGVLVGRVDLHTSTVR